MENSSIKVLRSIAWITSSEFWEKNRCIISCELSLLTWIVFLKSYHWELLFLDLILLSSFLDVIIGKTFNRISFKSLNTIDMLSRVLVGEQLLHWGKNMIQTMWIGYYHVVKESTTSCVKICMDILYIWVDSILMPYGIINDTYVNDFSLGLGSY